MVLLVCGLPVGAFVIGLTIPQPEIKRLQAEVARLERQSSQLNEQISEAKKRDEAAQRGHDAKKLCFDISKQESRYSNYVGWEYQDPDDNYPNGRCFVTFKQTGKKVDCGEEPSSKSFMPDLMHLFWDRSERYSLCKDGKFRNEY
jgi:hypothetical protein